MADAYFLNQLLLCLMQLVQITVYLLEADIFPEVSPEIIYGAFLLIGEHILDMTRWRSSSSGITLKPILSYTLPMIV